jgi:hypothetical protein
MRSGSPPARTPIEGISASRFGALQGIETMLFERLARTLVAFSAWWTHQRTV